MKRIRLHFFGSALLSPARTSPCPPLTVAWAGERLLRSACALPAKDWTADD